MLRFQFKQLLVCLLPLLLPSKLLAAIEGDVYSMDLEQLMSIEVVSASKKSQTLLKTAAAAHIITEEDIRRSGATSLPEVLRGVPGVQVAQIDANKWAVSMRGFNNRFATKLLVMIDGRSIYTPLFSGVYWNMHDMLLEDIDRIEVIRGPGGTLWGANAVNGVINIITKKADETQGTQITFLGGSLEKNISARYGARINNQTSFRVYAKGRHNERFSQQSQLQSLGPANDQWRNFTTGFRVDGEIDGNTDWMLQGGYNVGTADQFVESASLTPPSNLRLRDAINYNTGNMLFLWNKQLSLDNKWRVQVYYDYFNRTALSTTHNIHTVDIEIQNQRRFFDRHNVVWGFGYRSILDELEPGFEVSFSPEKLHFKTFNTFFQNEVQLTEKLRFTVGSKFEHNDFTGFEYQPSARVLFEVNERNSVWAAFSRAVR
ncbi:MAG: TonB-dependent receptor plug domain-containing protein, partial [Nitrosomonas sp.]|nr:TonB-dependent receptor plug domain-containing protein [Nitrosomonas sp.]